MADDGRKMIYPLTVAQQIKYFPFRYHWKHMPRFKECFYALFLVLPLAYYMERAAKSPSNVRKYELYLQKQEEERLAHMRHLEGYYEDQHKH